LKARGLRPVEIITAESLVYSNCIEHRVATNDTSTQICLADGRAINSASVCGTLNRLHFLPTAHLSAANRIDREYAQQEIYALFLSWLEALPGVTLNSPAPRGLCGAWRHPSEWNRLSSQAGLKTAAYRQGTSLGQAAPVPLPNDQTASVIVLDQQCFGTEAAANIRQSCIKLAQASQVKLLEVNFSVNSNGEWFFSGATPLPEIRLGGEPFLDHLCEALKL
jgi:hypothetical protein